MITCGNMYLNNC